MTRLVPISGSAPDYWASYLVNGDASALEAEEKAQADRFAEWLGGAIVDCSEDSFFAHRHDATQFGVLAATCCTYTALVESSDEA